MASLQDIFRQYEAFGARDASTGLEGRSWAKLCKDAGLYCKKYTTTDADLTFTKVKGKAGKKINVAQFEQALELVAEKKGVAVSQLWDAIIKAGGPKSSGTKAEAVRFFDDPSMYTGVHAHGGPSTTDQPKDLSGLCNRFPADARGISKAKHH